MIHSGTQLNKEFRKVLDAIFGTDGYEYGGFGYSFMENWMRYNI